MKNYNLIPQEKDNYFVYSVLQAIFDFHGKRLNQMFYDFNYPKVNLINPSEGKIKLNDYEEIFKECMKQKVFLD